MRSILTVLGSLRPNAKLRDPLPPVARRMFLLSFTSEFIVIYPFYVIMFGQRSGVSAAGVGMLLAIWMVVSVAAEVPTGIIADKFSKHWSLVLGQIMQFATFCVWLVAPSFAGYLTGFVIWGIGEAFLSGAFQAYLYESLDADNKKVFGKIYARTSAMNMFAYMAAYLIAFLIGPHYPLLLVLSMAVSAVSVGITFSLPGTRSQVEVEVRPKVLASAVHAIRHSPGLWRILVLAVLVGCLMEMLGEYLPVYYQQVGLPTQTVALWMALGSGTAALLYWWMHHVEEQLWRYRLAILLAATGLLALSFWGGAIVAVLGMFIFSRVLRVVSVSNETAIQHRSPNSARATVGSLYSFAGKLLSAGMVALVGFFAIDDRIVVPVRWSIIAVVVSFVVLTLLFSIRHGHPIHADVKAEA